MPNNDNKENQQDEYQQDELDKLADEELAEQAEKQKNYAKAPDNAQIEKEVISDIQQMQQELNIPDAPPKPAPKAPKKETSLDEEVEALQRQADAEEKAKAKGPVRQPLYKPVEAKKKPVAQTYQKTGSDLRNLCEDMRNAHSIFGKSAYDNVEKALNQVSKDWDSFAAARDPKKARDDMQRVMELSAIYLAGKVKNADKLTGVAKERFDAVSNVMKLMNKQIKQLNRVLDKQEKAAEKPDPVKKQAPLVKL